MVAQRHGVNDLSASNDSPVWLWVHGYLGSEAIWGSVLNTVRAQHHVMTLDLPGFGALAGQTSPQRIADFAGFVLETMRERGVTRFGLLGHSMGGQITQEVALQAPDRVRAAVLYGTGPVGAMPGRFEPIERSRERLRADGVSATAARIAATWFHAQEAAVDWTWVRELAHAVSVESADHCLEAMRDWSREADLAKISCPTQIIWGEADRSYAWSEQLKLWSQIPNASLAVLPRAAHVAHLDQPELFCDTVLNFMRHCERQWAN